jgi:hypothetical protein
MKSHGKTGSGSKLTRGAGCSVLTQREAHRDGARELELASRGHRLFSSVIVQ